jgi:hypothetical protein
MAVTNPGYFNEPDTNSVLWRRHERASDQIWIPGANITLRSAITAAVLGAAKFPVINDPRPPTAGGPGQLGDILLPTSTATATEFEDARTSCAMEWDKLAMTSGTPLVGPIALNLRRFVNAAGTPQPALGLGNFTNFSGPSPNAPCVNPPTVTAAEGGFMGVADFSFVGAPPVTPPGTLNGALDAKVVAHEFGHILFLGHGDGLDNDNDGMYDGFCDATEDPFRLPTSIMHPDLTATTPTVTVTALQQGTSRGLARVYSGSQIDPPAQLVNGDTLTDHRMDLIRDVQGASVDMTGVSMTINNKKRRVILSHHLYGVAPRRIRRESGAKTRRVTSYAAFLDLDSEQGTGGRPAALGFRTRFRGADLVTRVLVRQRKARPKVWRFTGGRFVDVTDRRVRGTIRSPVGEEAPFPIFDVVSADLPANVVGDVGRRVRLQAITAVKGNGVDFLPGKKATRRRRANASVDLFINRPKFPVCSTTPQVVQPGGVVRLEASGFKRRGAGVHVILGDELIANLELNRKGNLSAAVVIPGNARRGPRLITVGVDTTALTADCVVQVGT